MYYLLYSICYLISLLPFSILYRIADIIYLVIYHLTKYRRKVVRENLLLSFPEKNEKEIISIEKKYYHHLADMMVEVIKMLSISKTSLKNRLKTDYTPLKNLYQQGKSCQVHLGHNFNWEWANLRSKLEIDIPFIIVYKPISNKIFEKLMTTIRSRFGTILISTEDIRTGIPNARHTTYVTALVADQNPPITRRSYWVPFLNRMTAFYKGPELSARRTDLPVLFYDIKKIKRGYYEGNLIILSEHPQLEAEGVITEKFAQLLEKSIREQPEIWVWSHRRWKHKFPLQHIVN